ncbi:MAG TPA: BON domain-containing protein [Gemmatimonadales bacterium]
MSRIRKLEATDLVAAAAGAVLGISLGLVLGGAVGRVNSRRLKSAWSRWTGREKLSAKRWTEEDAERLEARVLDALGQDVVLARRRIRVSILGMGLIELTGAVLHTAEIGVASDVVQQVEGVETVLNHLVVETPTRPVAPATGPNAPRAARG